MVESEDGTKEALRTRIQLALFAAEDGSTRWRAWRRSGRPTLCAAGICYLAGLMEEGNRLVAGIPDAVRRDSMVHLHKGVLAATLGGAPGPVAGFEGMVGLAAFEFMDAVLWTKVVEGDWGHLLPQEDASPFLAVARGGDRQVQGVLRTQVQCHRSATKERLADLDRTISRFCC